MSDDVDDQLDDDLDETAGRPDEPEPELWLPENPGERLRGTLVRWELTPEPGPAETVAVLKTREGLRAVPISTLELELQFGQRGRPGPGSRLTIEYQGDRPSGMGLRPTHRPGPLEQAQGGSVARSFQVIVDRPAPERRADVDRVSRE
jgi:hypothetical protein